ncbi:MAG: hypothetical protein ACP5LK_00025 [Candidatus Bipolaricaulaceae bacterium]
MRRAGLLALVFGSALAFAGSYAVVSPSPNPYGWHNTVPVTVEIYTTDLSCLPIYVNGVPQSGHPAVVVLSSEGVHTLRYRDNCETAEKTVVVRIDLTPPTVVIRVPEPGGRYLLNQPVNVDWVAYDNLSGIAEVESTATPGSALDTRSPGQNKFRIWVRDRAGNEREAWAWYYVHFVLEAVHPNGFYLDQLLPPEERKPLGRGTLFARYPLHAPIIIAFMVKDYFGHPYTRAYPELTVLWVDLSGEEERLPLRGWARIPYDETKGYYFLAYSTKDHSSGFYELQIYFGDGRLERIRVELTPPKE